MMTTQQQIDFQEFENMYEGLKERHQRGGFISNARHYFSWHGTHSTERLELSDIRIFNRLKYLIQSDVDFTFDEFVQAEMIKKELKQEENSLKYQFQKD